MAPLMMRFCVCALALTVLASSAPPQPLKLDLDSLLHPIPTDVFLRDYFEKKPLVLHGRAGSEDATPACIVCLTATMPPTPPLPLDLAAFSLS